MRSVMVTHADEPIGRRIVKTLFHDPEVAHLLAVGSGAAPRAFDRFLADPRSCFSYVRATLSRHRPVSDLFRSERVQEAQVDTVVHVPAHQPQEGHASQLPAGVPPRTAEARLVLQHCLETAGIRALVALGSAFVYRLWPGNANRVRETSELDLEPNISPALRSWVDCDMIFHAEVGHERLRVSLLRLPTVVASGGYVYLNPLLAGRASARLRPLGFDPVCALVADKDVAQAVAAAIHAERAGVYNIAGAEAVPLSVLGLWTGRPCLPVPGPLLRVAAGVLRAAGGEARLQSLTGTHLHYGFTLDTTRAERELGFRPAYRIGVSRAGDGELRVETAPV
jgi:nucleoside-diphosphate-sugar epimerase